MQQAAAAGKVSKVPTKVGNRAITAAAAAVAAAAVAAEWIRNGKVAMKCQLLAARERVLEAFVALCGRDINRQKSIGLSAKYAVPSPGSKAHLQQRNTLPDRHASVFPVGLLVRCPLPAGRNPLANGNVSLDSCATLQNAACCETKNSLSILLIAATYL
ncbi:unnamed protein product [Ceratitis capitata]|uniref:(Mediterranean fruit fly) hypothetical protein n=1 Tax=Ceratitis capitata TaxID=7213 RepID=A0A811VFA4_CERCA|nr:unnamed protein product [Ceratitis capitata]